MESNSLRAIKTAWVMHSRGAHAVRAVSTKMGRAEEVKRRFKVLACQSSCQCACFALVLDLL